MLRPAPQTSAARPRRRLLGALLAAALVATGCGEKAEPDPPPALSADEFVTQGNEICAQARARTLAATATPAETPEANAELVGRLISISESEVTALADLEPPNQLEDPMRRYLDARVETLDQLRDAEAAAEAEEAFEFARIQAQIADEQPERAQLAAAVGFEECSRPLPGQESGGEDGSGGGSGSPSGGGSGSDST